ncbi:fibronectin type III domain-containing protein [Spirosoma sp. SC4-14]|uniref:fibronectin type III domain-containing protein n=1 Tax=Spirosoma sp. SC4-14 TaxID=3128900 RepID=UPI0030D23CD7
MGYQLQWRSAGNASWNTEPIITTTSTSLTGLTNNTVYEWQVRTICAVGDTSAFTTGAAFQTQCYSVNYLTVNAVSFQSASLYWSQIGINTTYDLRWRPVGVTEWTVVSGLGSGYYTLTGLPEDTSIEWQVRTVCAPSIVADYVAGPLFRTLCLPPGNPQATRVFPDAAELNWDSPVANVHFDLQWRVTGNANWTLVENITAPEYILTGLTNSTAYEWQVRTVCSPTSKSAFSDVRVFQTQCQAPYYLTTSAITYNSAILQWNAPGANLQWRQAGTTDWTTIPNAKSPYNLTGLANNTSYEWHIQTVCSATATSAYTAPELLTTQCTAPWGVYAYANGSKSITINWGADESAYEVQWRMAGTTSWSVASNIYNSSHTITNLVPETTYEWQVRKMCSATESSIFATGQPIKVSCSGPPYGYTENATNTSIDLVWNELETGGNYEVQWRKAGTTDWQLISDITTKRYTLTGLQADVDYEWQIRSTCSITAVSGFSSLLTFRLSCQQPNYVSTTYIDYSSAQLSWGGLFVFPPYEVQYRQVGATDWQLISGLTSVPYSLTGLTNNTAYEWRVRSSCPSGGSTDFSAVQTLQTQCGDQLPTSLGTSNIAFNSAQLTWFHGNKSNYEIQYREVGSQDWIVRQVESSETEPYSGSPYKQYTVYGLTPGKTYEWRIRTVCASSIYSDFVNGPQFTVACLSPEGIYSSQQISTALTIKWNSPAVTTTFDLQWRQASVNVNWNQINGITNNAYTLTNLTPGQLYEYRIRQACSVDNVSDFSASYIVQLQCLVPDLLRADKVSGTSARLQWGDIGVGSDLASTFVYDMRYRPSGTQDWTTVSGIMSTTYSLTGLTPGVTYEWQLQTICSPASKSGDWVSSTFYTWCSVPYTYGYSPKVSATSAILTWGGSYFSDSGQTYFLQWRPVGSAEWKEVSVVSSDYTVTYLLTGLTTGVNYEWQVAAACGSGRSNFASGQSFLTACPANGAYVSIHSIGATTAQLNINGYDALPDVIYTVQYRKAGTILWTETPTITGNLIKLTGLESKTNYECRVRAVCLQQGESTYSFMNSFVTQCVGAINWSGFTISDQAIGVKWTSVDENSTYNLQWREGTSSEKWSEVSGITGSNFTLTNLKPGTSYQLRIQEICSATDVSSFQMNYISTLSPTIFHVDADSISYESIFLNWLSGPDSTDYILRWRVRDGNWQTSGKISSKRYLLTGLMSNATYDVRVSYIDKNGKVVEGTNSFSTNCPYPSNLTTTAIQASSARLTWSLYPNAPVTVQWRIAGASSWNSVTGVTGNEYELTGLSNFTTYEWRLQTPCGEGRTNESFSNSFRTVCQMPVSLNTYNVTTQSARISWIANGSQYTIRYRIFGTANWITVVGLPTNQYTLTGLTNNTSYEWEVASTCDPAINTIFTSSVFFRTQCSTPYNLYVDAVSVDQAQLSWSGDEPGYQLQWKATNSQNWNTLSAVTSPYILTGLTAGVSYQWRIRSACATTTEEPFSAGYAFTPQCFVNYYDIPSAVNIISNSATLTWTNNVLQKSMVRWRQSGTQNWTVLGNVTSPYTLTGLLNNTYYEWQRKAECESEYGTVTVFQTQCKVPGGLQVDQQTATSARLRWNNSGDGQGYEVRWRMLGTSAWSTISNITSISCLVSGLTSYTQYEWQVRSQCAGSADFPITALFTTINDCASSLYTVKAGSWDDPTVWSCGRVPTVTDSIKLYHTLSVPASYTGHVRTIRYETGGGLTFSVGATIRLNN